MSNSLSCFLHCKCSSPQVSWPQLESLTLLLPLPVLGARQCLLDHCMIDAGSAEQTSLLLSSSLCRCYTAQGAAALCFCQDRLAAAPAHPARHPEPQCSTVCSWPSQQWPRNPLFCVICKFDEIIICYPETSLERAGGGGSITGSHSTVLSPSPPALTLRARARIISEIPQLQCPSRGNP